jgi:hypothetical protein
MTGDHETELLSVFAQWAQYYTTNKGWTVFPGRIGDNSEKKSWKSAETSEGEGYGVRWGATRNLAEIQKDFADPDRQIIGVPTGSENGFFVVDVDTTDGHKYDGFASLKSIEAKHGAMPPTLMAGSPSGSVHYLFKHPGFRIKTGAGTDKKGIAPGIDIKGDGGMIFAPPSVRPGRGAYKWLNDLPIAQAPLWLLEWLREHSERPERITKEHHSRQGEFSPRDVRSMLAWMSERGAFESYDDWVSIGQALKIGFWDDGLELWESVTEPGRYSCDQKWRTFKDTNDGNAVTLATWFRQAREAGWRLSAAELFSDIAPTVSSPPVAPAAPSKSLIKHSAEFLQGFVPPDYILDGVLQRGFCYSMTAKTGTGKTAVAMCFSAHVATGRPLNGLSVAQGEVIYLAGENPTDIQMRWLGLTQEMKIDPATVPVYFLPGVIPISQNVAAITQEVEARALRPTLVVVDTAAAYFEGDNENDNVQQGNNARLLRSLTLLPGGPCVLILCHPTKRAGDDDLLPRGGGAFLNEVDGNIALKANDTIIGAEVQGKFRGPAFPPLQFKLDAVREHPLLKDSKGRSIPTVIAREITDGEMASNVAMQECDENRLLRLIEKHPRASLQELANLMGAKTSKSKVDRLVQKMINLKILKREGRNLKLTAIGEKELNDVDRIVSPSFQASFPGGPFPVLPTIKN